MPDVQVSTTIQWLPTRPLPCGNFVSGVLVNFFWLLLPRRVDTNSLLSFSDDHQLHCLLNISHFQVSMQGFDSRLTVYIICGTYWSSSILPLTKRDIPYLGQLLALWYLQLSYGLPLVPLLLPGVRNAPFLCGRKPSSNLLARLRWAQQPWP